MHLFNRISSIKPYLPFTLILGLFIYAGTYTLESLWVQDLIENHVQQGQTTLEHLKKIRRYYHQYIVKPVRSNKNIKLHYDYKKKKNTLPLAVSFIQDTSLLSQKNPKNTQISYYGQRPLPNRPETKRDAYQKQALAYLAKKPKSYFIQRSSKNGHEGMRVATSSAEGVIEISVQLVEAAKRIRLKVRLIATALTISLLFMLIALYRIFKKHTLRPIQRALDYASKSLESAVDTSLYVSEKSSSLSHHSKNHVQSYKQIATSAEKLAKHTSLIGIYSSNIIVAAQKGHELATEGQLDILELNLNMQKQMRQQTRLKELIKYFQSIISNRELETFNLELEASRRQDPFWGLEKLTEKNKQFSKICSTSLIELEQAVIDNQSLCDKNYNKLIQYKHGLEKLTQKNHEVRKLVDQVLECNQEQVRSLQHANQIIGQLDSSIESHVCDLANSSDRAQILKHKMTHLDQIVGDLEDMLGKTQKRQRSFEAA